MLLIWIKVEELKWKWLIEVVYLVCLDVWGSILYMGKIEDYSRGKGILKNYRLRILIIK